MEKSHEGIKEGMRKCGKEQIEECSKMKALLIFLKSGRALCLSLPPLLHPIIRLQQQRETRWADSLLDLHAATVHLDDLGSEGLDRSQYQLLVL